MLIDKTTGACLIPLISYKYPGLFAMVDPSDYPLVKGHRWYPKKDGNAFYAGADYYHIDGARTTILMHKLISLFDITDHENQNGLDNRRFNLRKATRGQNCQNSQKQTGAYTSRFKGVSWSKVVGMWRAQIMANRKHREIGYFSDEVEAALAYDRAAIECHGEFARTNASLGLFDLELVA